MNLMKTEHSLYNIVLHFSLENHGREMDAVSAFPHEIHFS